VTTIGVDLGGTKVLAGVVAGGAVSATIKRPTPTGGPAAVVATLAEMVAELGGAERVGIGTPGVVDPGTGTVSHAPNLRGWDRAYPLAAELRSALGRTEVRVDNDVNVGVLGEWQAGAARGERDVLGVFVGTGVGGGLVLDGSLRHGPRGITGEIGHVTVVPGGRECTCGRLGHLEAYGGRAGMEAEARRRHAAGASTALVDLAGDGRMKSGVFAKALSSGDEMASALLGDAVDALGLAIASALTLLDVPVVVVGGGVADKLGRSLVERVAAAVEANVLAGSAVDVRPAALGDLAGVVGAAGLWA
jgi:glucokinase